ncbi:hypothetical protein HMPREF0812_01793 [Streptococcus agalactiae]|nr:hypothetical protein HMPREF0812_01793 [Streptococcus agalactiae]
MLFEKYVTLFDSLQSLECMRKYDKIIITIIGDFNKYFNQLVYLLEQLIRGDESEYFYFRG